MACFFAILFVPTANTIVTIDDRASGIAATATATENMNESKIICVISPFPAIK